MKLYVKNHGEPIQDEKLHPGITCDGCENNVKGFRFKCTQCYDFDLCSACEAKNVHPADHEMICIKVPRTGQHFMRHPGFNRGACRRGGPFGGRGPFRGRGPFHGRGAHAFSGPFPFAGIFQTFPNCSQQGQQKSEEKKEEKSSDPKNESCPKEGECENLIEMIASTFGFDPEVAKCHFTTFCDDMKKYHEEQAKESQTRKSEGDQTESETPEEKVDDINVDFQKEPTAPESQKCQNEDIQMEEQVNEEKKDDVNNTENKDGFQNELESMVGHFSDQFGLTPEAQQNIQGGLNSLLQGIFQPPSFARADDKKV